MTIILFAANAIRAVTSILTTDSALPRRRVARGGVPFAARRSGVVSHQVGHARNVAGNDGKLHLVRGRHKYQG